MIGGDANRQSLNPEEASDQKSDDDSQAGLSGRTIEDIDNDFADAIVHRQCGWGLSAATGRLLGFSAHKVLGLRLRPFSFWHAAQLDFICSPFAGHKSNLDFAALWVAARICQTRYPRIPRRTRFEYLRKLHALWKYSQLLRPALAPDLSRITSPFLEELSKFALYLRDYNTRPTYGERSDSVSVNSPWYLYETSMLRRFNPRITKAQAWDSVIGETRWDNVGMIEASGHQVSIETPEDRKAQKEAADPNADNRAVFDEATNTWRPV